MTFRNHPRLFLDVGQLGVSASPGFVVRQCHSYSEPIRVVAVEDKCMKHVWPSSGYGESQIAVEILSAAFDNYVHRSDENEESGEVIYGIRFLSNYVTFYRATVPLDYLQEFANGIYKAPRLEILRFSGALHAGLDLFDAAERKVALGGLIALKTAL